MKLKTLMLAGLSAATLATAALAQVPGVIYRYTGDQGEYVAPRLEFEPVAGALLGEPKTSAPMRYVGPPQTVTLTATGGEIRACPSATCAGASWSTSAVVRPGQWVQARTDAPNQANSVAEVSISGPDLVSSFKVTAGAGATLGTFAGTTAPFETLAQSTLSTFEGAVSAPIAVTGGEYRICASNGQCGGFTAASGTVRHRDQVQLRVLAGEPEEVKTVTLTAGSASRTWTVTASGDTDPDVPSFVAATGVEPGAEATSAPVTLTGFDGRLTLTATNGTFSVDGGAVGTTATVRAGQVVRAKGTAGAFGATRTVELKLGQRTASFAVSTRAKDEVADAFTIAAVTGANPSAQVISAAVTPTGYDAPITVSVGNGQISVAGGTYAASASLSSGQSFTVRTTASASYATMATASVTVGTGAPVTFDVTTRTAVTTPGAFTVAASTNVEPATQVVSGAVTLTGLEAPTTFTVADGEASVAGGVYAASGTVAPGQSLTLRTTSATFGASKVVTLTAGGVAGTWNVTTRTRDTVPDTVTFAALADQTASATVTSEIRQLVNHDGVTATVSGTGASLRVCSTSSCSGGTVGGWTTSAAVAKNEFVQLQMVVGAAGEKRAAFLAYGAASPATWDVTAKSGAYSGVYALARVSSGNVDLAFVSIPPNSLIRSHAEYKALCESYGFDQNMNGNGSPVYSNAGNYNSTSYYSTEYCSYLGSGNNTRSRTSNYRNYGLPLGVPFQVIDRGCGSYSGGSTFGGYLDTRDSLTANADGSFTYGVSNFGAGSGYGENKTVQYPGNQVLVCQTKR